MKNNRFKIIFKNSQNKEIDVDYQVADSHLAYAWLKKIKHLKNVPFDPIESNLVDLSDLDKIYKQYCQFASLTPHRFPNAGQEEYNAMHKIYEQNHDRLSRLKDNGIIYKFHNAIHHAEQKGNYEKNIVAGWGVKEGMLTENYNCNQFYENNILANQIYLPYAELGKTPLYYWLNKEPNNQIRFNQLAKPHRTFRAKFFVAVADYESKPLPAEFVSWFDSYRESWLHLHGLKDWTAIDEQCAPLLATTDFKENLENHTVQKIIYEHSE